MKRVFETLLPLIRLVVRRPAWVLVLAVALSVAAALCARNLRVDPDFANLIPVDYPSVQALERIRATVGGGETSVDLAIESPSFEANLAFAEALLPRAMQLSEERSSEPYFVRAELRRETEFLESNGLYFATNAELDRLEEYLEDQILDAKLKANPLYFELDDEEDGGEPDIGEEIRASVDRIVGSEYHVSPDSTVLVMRLFASGSSTDIAYIERLYRDLAELVEAVGPTAFHPELETTLAGRLWRQRVEVRAITDDVLGSLGLGVLFVLLTVVGYFLVKTYRVRIGRQLDIRALLVELVRAPVTTLVIGLPLAMSLVWTAAAAYLLFGTLNLLSSTLGLVLFGLGIDYGIHFYARYIEERRRGSTVHVAAIRTFESTGQAIAVGALTTAAPLYILMIADFRGFSEFGVIAGTGVLLALLATLVVTPALLAFSERYGLLRLGDRASGATARKARVPGAKGVLVGSFVALGLALVMIPRLEFEYRFDRLEPTYPEWTRLSAKVQQAFSTDGRRNPAYIVVDDPSEVPAVVAALRQKIAEDTVLHIVDADSFVTTIRSVESLQERFPMTVSAQQAKLHRIAVIRDSLLADPFVQGSASYDVDRLTKAAQTRAPIAVEDIPDFLKKQFITKTGELGSFITIFPAVGLSDGRKSIAFAEDVGAVITEDGSTYYAGSPSIVAADMLRLMRREAPYMATAAYIAVIALLWWSFGRINLAMMALMPLMIGLVCMIPLMELFGLRLNFYNLSVLPAIIGIGNDAGAHMVHRFREKGMTSIGEVLRTTGEHVTVGALTTMVGFGGLLLSFHPGLNTMGLLAVIGISTTLAAAVGFLPALIQVVEDKVLSSRKGSIMRWWGNGQAGAHRK